MKKKYIFGVLGDNQTGPINLKWLTYTLSFILNLHVKYGSNLIKPFELNLKYYYYFSLAHIYLLIYINLHVKQGN